MEAKWGGLEGGGWRVEGTLECEEPWGGEQPVHISFGGVGVGGGGGGWLPLASPFAAVATPSTNC